VDEVLGKVVATLVNENKTPGSYRPAWNARGVASVISFKRLEAGSVVDVKKRVLLN
jgi:hypothetical protein